MERIADSTKSRQIPGGFCPPYSRFAAAWFMQGGWALITPYPVYAINQTPVHRLAKLGPLDGIGLGLWAAGFLIEAVADYQKSQWASRVGKEARKTQFINEGLWSMSRHPNYFGEITLWLGTFLICSSGAAPYQALKFAISPLFIFGLLYKVSGIPMLEKSSEKRFGHLQSYQEYKKNVPELIPRLTPFKSTKTA